MRTSAAITKLVQSTERAEALDAVSDKLSGLLSKIIKPGPVEDTLSGTPVGHPLHPALVAVPIGAWASSLVFDALGDDEAAQRLIGIGLVAAAPTALSGASDWLSVQGAEQRVGLVHALLNYGAMGAFGASWFARRAGNRGTGRALSGVGALFVGAAGFLGGHLTYAQGVGVDTTAFSQLPTDWTAVDGLSDPPGEDELASGAAGGIPILVTRRSGQLVAMADRCTHRGAPLHEGEVRDGCVHCPWHDSVFSLDDGSVTSGPATRPQPLFDVREQDGALQVRRAEERALRSNPVGS